MEGTSETVKTSSKREHRRAQCASNQVGGVCADIPALVVGVDCQVQAHQLNKVLVLAKSKLIGQVEAVILVLLDGSDISILEDVAVDLGGDGGQLGNQVHGVLEGVLPIVLLVDTLGVGLGEGGLVLKSGDSEGELGHWVQSGRAAVNQFLNELGHIGAGGPFCGEGADLLFAWDLAGQEQPEKSCSAISKGQCANEFIYVVSIPSGRGSSPPGALGSTFWHSGIYERN